MTTVKISSTDHFLAIIPHQLGHHPAECIVAALASGTAYGPVARLDLPPERHVARAAAQFRDSLLRVDPTAALLIAYETVPGAARSMRVALHDGLIAHGVGIVDHLVVRDGRWWGACCRPEGSITGLLADHIDGHPVPDETTVPAVAEFVLRGSAPLASRDDVSALVAEDTSLSGGVGDALARLWDAFVAEVGAAGAAGAAGPAGPAGAGGASEQEDGPGSTVRERRHVRARAWLDQVDRVPDLWARVLVPEGEQDDAFCADDEEIARMLQSLRNKSWRDALIAWMSSVMFPLDQVDDASSELLVRAVPSGPVADSDWSESVLRRLLWMARRVPDECPVEAAAISTLVACVAWGVGNGSTAGDAVHRALRVDPDYTLAVHLGRLIEFQVRPPRRWADVAA